MSACQQPQVSPLVVHQLSSAQRRPQAPPFFFLGGANQTEHSQLSSIHPSIQPHPHTSYLQALWTRAGREIYHVEQLLIFARGTEISHTWGAGGKSRPRSPVSAFLHRRPQTFIGVAPNRSAHRPPTTSHKISSKNISPTLLFQHNSQPPIASLLLLLNETGILHSQTCKKQPKKIWHVRSYFLFPFFLTNKKLISWNFSFLECKIGLIPFSLNAHFYRRISILTLSLFSLEKSKVSLTRTPSSNPQPITFSSATSPSFSFLLSRKTVILTI